MLVDVTEDDGPQRGMGLKDGCQVVVIGKVYFAHHGVTDGHRWMMQSHHQRQIPAQRIGEALLQPLQLMGTEPTG